MHGSELSARSPFPERESRRSVAVGHPETGVGVENLARNSHFRPLPGRVRLLMPRPMIAAFEESALEGNDVKIVFFVEPSDELNLCLSELPDPMPVFTQKDNATIAK